MNKAMKVLFIDSTHNRLPEKLHEAGFIVDYNPEIPAHDIIDVIPEYDGLIIRSKIKVDKIVLDAAKKLKFIGRVGAGLENIDVEYAKSKNIQCFNSPEGNRDAVGEQAVGMLLTLFNNILKADNEVRNGEWIREGNRGVEIKGKTIGIVGYGNMGSAFAQRLKGFGAKVISYDKYKFNYTNEYVTEKNLLDLFKETDILSLHVPLTEETRFMVNDEFINRFNKKIYIINTARGKVLKTDDLVKNMQAGKVLGAALDVLEYEQTSFENLHSDDTLPEAFQYLIQSRKVVLTPHIAGWTHESNIKLSEYLADKIIAAFT